MTIINSWRNAAAVLGAAAGVLIFATTAAFSAEDGLSAGPVDPMSVPVTVYTGDPAARRAGGAADQLLAFVRQQGRARVIVGLRTAARAENTLSAAQVQAQRQAQRAVEDAILGRVFGSAASAEVNRYEIIPFMSVWVTEAQLARLLADPGVASIEKDLLLEPALGESLPLIHADDVFLKGANGTGFAVAIIDSGVAKTHPMITGKVVAEGCYSTNNAANGFTSLCRRGVTDTTAAGSGVNCPVSVTGCDHGTHVASIAAGNSEKYKGVGREAKIIAIKVATRRPDARCPNPCAAILADDVIDGLKRVFNLRNAFEIAAVNMSFSVRADLFAETCDTTIPGLTNIIRKLRKEAGIPSVVSAGNDSNTAAVTIPACIAAAVAGSTTNDDRLWQSSNTAPLVDLFAPGRGIDAAVPRLQLHNADERPIL